MISIIIPVYNAEKTLKSCLDSILHQTYKQFEVILINDGSKDNSQAIIDSYKNKCPEIIKAYSQINQGVAKTRNKGIDLANGEYLCFIDNDDYIEKDYLERLLSAIQKENSELVICGYRRIRTNGEIIFKREAKDNRWTKYMMVAPWGRIYKTSSLKKHQIEFLSGGLWEDVYFNIIANFRLKVSYIGYIGYNWVYNERSVSNTVQKGLDQHLDLVPVLEKIKNDTEKIGIPKEEVAYFEYFNIKASVWYLLHSGKGADYKKLLDRRNKLFLWLKNNFPKYLNNKFLWPFNDLSEALSVKMIVSTYIFLKLIKIDSIILYFYSKM